MVNDKEEEKWIIQMDWFIKELGKMTKNQIMGF